MLRLKKVYNWRILLVYLLAFISFFTPIYISDTNQHNLSFALAEVVMLLYFANVILRHKIYRSNEKIYLILIFVYFIVFYIYNVKYLHCYWAMFYKTGAFLLLYSYVNYYERTPQNDEIENIANLIIKVFACAVIISLVFYVLHGDSVYFEWGNFRIRYDGTFSDKRLTWVYMHKSSYGMLLTGVLWLTLKNKSIKYRKIIIALLLLALLAINSVTSIIASLGLLYASYIETKQIDRKYVLKFLVSIIVILVVGFATYIYISGIRSVTSMGNRVYIWKMIPYYFKQYPMGMGKAFYDTRILVDELNFSVNNCHNVFLNEMLHYSTPVGILYCVLLLFFPIKTIVKSSHKFRDIIVLICLLIPLSFDMSMNDTILPIYTMILYCGFACYNN